MHKQAYGQIFITSSNTIYSPVLGVSAYVAAKAANVGFSRVTAFEAGPRMTAKIINYGLVRTESNLAAQGAPEDQDICLMY